MERVLVAVVHRVPVTSAMAKLHLTAARARAAVIRLASSRAAERR
jgi:hypothetical protein